MKYLSDYTDDNITKALKKAGAFYTFGQQQFDAAKKEGIKYVGLPLGLICPKENVDTLQNEMDAAFTNGIKQDLEENGKEAIIRRELNNYECYYTGSIADAVGGLENYNISKSEIQKVFASTRDMVEDY